MNDNMKEDVLRVLLSEDEIREKVRELGGKSPCIVDETADLSVAAARIIWGKCLNSGQTCVAPDYVLVARSRKDALIREMQPGMGENQGEGRGENQGENQGKNQGELRAGDGI